MTETQPSSSLSELENLFKDRYTPENSAYAEIMKGFEAVIMIHPWNNQPKRVYDYTNRGRGRGGYQDYNRDNRGGYKRSYDRRDGHGFDNRRGGYNNDNRRGNYDHDNRRSYDHDSRRSYGQDNRRGGHYDNRRGGRGFEGSRTGRGGPQFRGDNRTHYPGC